MNEKIELVIDTMVQRDQAPLGNEIFDGNIRPMGIWIKAMMAVKGMLAISVFGATGTLPIQESRNPAVYDLTRLEGDPGSQEKEWGKTDTLTYLQAITVIGEPMGWIRICYSLEEIKGEQHLTNRIMAGVLASILVVMLVVLNLIISRTILRSITSPRDAMAEHPEKTAPDRFILRTKACVDALQVEIEDNGPGMTPEQSKRIFEPFFTTKPVGVGTGLGLSVSYFIITKNHNGSMEVASVPGKGTNFIIRLPIQQEEL